MRGKASAPYADFSEPDADFAAPYAECPTLAHGDAQQTWLDGASALAQADMFLAQENHANMLLAAEHMLRHTMQDNARLTRENMILRTRTQRPPGLQSQEHSDKTSNRSNRPKAVTSAGRGSMSGEVSTAASSSMPGLGSVPLGSWTLGTPGPPGKGKRSSDVSSSASSSMPGYGSVPLGSWTLGTSSPPGSRALDSSAGMDSPASEEPPLTSGTSVFMRNVPNDYTRTRLVELLHAEGFGGTYDFVYLPVDFRSSSGLGYAFINFLSLDISERFRQHFTGFNRWSVASDKVCQVTWSSLQGREAHIERFRNSPVMHESVPEDQKPALFEGFERVEFPKPTKKIRVPRHWHRRR